MDLTIGDPVLVEVMELNGIIATPKRLRATVCYVDYHKIGVTFADHTRQMFPKESLVDGTIRSAK